MFNRARLKLTAWYLLIIMFISVSFSLIIYRRLAMEVEQLIRAQRIRIFRDFAQFGVPPPAVDLDILEDSRHRIALSLVVINGFILITSGSLGYFLAGKTLKPISDMVEEQNRFISDASHELRTPLTSLKTVMEVALRDRSLEISDARKIISESVSEVDKLQYLSEGLLQIAQYQKPNGNEKFEKTDLPLLAKNAISKVQPLAAAKKIKIINNVKIGKVNGSKFSLSDLLIIIIDNAIKYSPAKSTITVSSAVNRKTAIMTVSDKGIGINQKDLPHIFDRFYRADEARTKSERGGYGLGLSIAKKIVERHNGTIEISSKLKKGTNVKIVLPLFS